MISGLRRFLSRLHSFLLPGRAEQELERELASHLALLEDDFLSRGLTARDARLAARRALGGVEQVKELQRDARSFVWLDDVRRDVSFALRTSARNAGFTSVVLLTLAFGIGANTTIFSVVNAVLLRPLPFPDPERLVVVSEADGGEASRGTNVSYPNFRDWSRLARGFDQLAAIQEGSVVLRTDREPARMPGAFVSAELFDLLGVAPLLGRTFGEKDERPGAAPTVVLSHDTWQSRLDGDPGLLGGTVILDDEAHTVIGVMPAGFRFPDTDIEAWMSLGSLADEPVMRIRRAHVLNAVARLAPSATLEGAQADMDAIAARLQAAHPGEDPDHGVRLTPMLDVLVAEARPGLLALLGGVGFVLLISCANVANLLLARAARRRREIAMRRAIGATPGRILRQLLIESLLLAAGGGALALLVAEGLRRALVGRLMDVVPRADGISIDWQVLAFTAAVSLATGVLFGLVPALRAAAVDVNRSLKDDGGRSDQPPANSRLRSGLVVAEIAVSLMLVVGAGLMIKSFWRVLGVDPGFQPDELVTLRTSLPPSKYAAAHPVVAFYAQLPARLEAIPGVVSVSAVNALPIRAGDSYGELTIEGRPFDPGDAPAASFRRVLPNYFRTMGIRLVKGREFDGRDTSDAARVVIVSESLAREHFPRGDALGTRIKVGPAADEPWLTIVGVAADVRNVGLEVAPRLATYEVHAQRPWRTMDLTVRTRSDPEALIAPLRAALFSTEPELLVTNIASMQQRISASLAPRRVVMSLMTTFAGVALLLAAVGVYGVVSFIVTERTHELGVRSALGASPGDLVRLVLRRGVGIACLGVVVGLGASLWIGRLIEHLLFDLRSSDPVTLSVVSGLLLAVSLVASYLPARLAGRLDPVEALRDG